MDYSKIKSNLLNTFSDYTFYNKELDNIQHSSLNINNNTLKIQHKNILNTIIQKINKFKYNNNTPKHLNNDIDKTKFVEIVHSKMFVKDETLCPPLYDNYNTYKIIYSESILFAFCLLIHDNFHFYSDSVKINFINELKYTLGIEFLKYKDNYKTIKINKNDFMNQLINGESINHKLFYSYLSDFFNINFIQYNIITNEPIFYNDFIENRVSIVIYYDNNNIICQQNCNSTSLIHGKKILDILKIDKPLDKELLKLSLKELQKIAISKSILTKKNAIKGEKNKKKNELIKEIMNISDTVIDNLNLI